MKLTTILLFSISFQIYATGGYSQQVSLEMKNVPLKTVFKEIQKQTGYYFLYSEELLEKTKNVDIFVQNTSLEDALNKSLQKTSLTYSIVEKEIVIKLISQQPDIAVVLPQPPPNFKVSGVIVDDESKPLDGASVKLKGTNKGVTTDKNGKFSIEVPDDGATLVLSYIGFEGVEMKVTKADVLQIKLKKLEGKSEEIVMIGYGTTTRKQLTTAVSKIDPKQIPNAANHSIPELLFGRAAGLQVRQQSTQPGGNIEISIRGKGTPLIVVDGIVYPNSSLEPGNGATGLQGVNRGILAGLNPEDIESIEILKDASAAIYGVAASNGVMLITTKKGRVGKMNTTYDGNESHVTNLSYLKPLSGTDYMIYYNQFSKDKYLSDRKMAPFGTVTPDLSAYQPKFSQDQITNNSTNTDWLGQVLRTGRIDNHTLTLNGGADKVVYYFSGSYFNQQGTLKGSDLTRYTGRMNVSFEMNKFMKLNASVNTNHNSYGNPQAGWQTDGGGTQGYNALQAALAYPKYLPVYDKAGNYSLFNFTGNPLSLLSIKDKTNFNGVLGNVSLDFTLIPKQLTGRLTYGYNNEYSYRDFFIPKTVFYNQIYRANANLSESRRQNQTMEATISYKRNFGNIMRLDAVAGVGQYIDDYSGLTVGAYGTLDGINTANISSGTSFPTPNSYTGQDKFRSFFTRANMDFFDRYLLGLSIRRDGADKFFPGNKYENFPAVSIGWKINNESFLKNAQAINLLKIRASYGITGERPGTSAYGGFAPDNVSAIFNSAATTYIPYSLIRFDNPNLKWPVTKILNIGLDFGLFHDRISGSIDWFEENKTRLLSNTTTPQLSIISTTPINGGQQKRKGFEFSINTQNFQSKDFGWTTTFNFTHYENRWVKRFPNDPPPPYGKVNDPAGEGIIYAYKTAGILQIGQTATAWQPANAQMPGSLLFVDVNGDKQLDFKDVVSYSGIPKGIIGFGNGFRYKKLDLNIFFYGQYGAWGDDALNAWADPLNLLSGTMSGTVAIKNVWSTANPTGTRPGVSYNGYSLGIAPGTDVNLVKRDFLRCRNITLGYNFPPSVVSKAIKSLRLYVDVQNVFTITSFKNVDPEIQVAGVKGASAPYPMTRTFSFGVRANF